VGKRISHLYFTLFFRNTLQNLPRKKALDKPILSRALYVIRYGTIPEPAYIPILQSELVTTLSPELILTQLSFHKETRQLNHIIDGKIRQTQINTFNY
jgi:hypothetical protein